MSAKPPPLLLLSSLALLVRWGVSLWPHSGQDRPPLHGDFEAQRHWMEVTTSLPLEQWYQESPDNDLLYWGLDYPPLTAYHSLALGHVSGLVNSSWTALHTSRGLEDPQHKLFMRLSVMATDIMVYLPAVFLVSQGRPSTLAPLLSLPSLILIDHGHFQYNSASLGLLLLAVAAMLRGRHLLASSMFSLALNYKQMELYHSLPFFALLLGSSLRRPTLLGKATMLTSIAATVLATFALVWAPFLALGPEAVLQVLRRCFPFGRGLFEDKVSNVWCCLDPLVKLRQLLTIPQLAQLSAATTLLLSLPSNLHLLLRPNTSTFLLSLASTALTFFLFSFQVHEKSILLFTVPLLLLPHSLSPLLPIVLPWASTLSTFSMLPLLLKDGLLLPTVATSVLHLTLLHTLPSLLPQPPAPRRPTSPAPTLPPSTSQLVLRGSMVVSLLGCAILALLTLTVPPPAKYPYLWPLAISVYSAAHFLFFLLLLHYIQFAHLPSPGVAGIAPSKKEN